MKLIYYRHNQYSKMDVLPLRHMNYTELTFVFSGTMEYISNGERVTLHDGDAIFANKRKNHTRKPIEQCDYISFNFYMEDGDEQFDLPLYLPNVLSAEIKLLLSACDEIFFNTEDCTNQICHLIYCLLKQLFLKLRPKQYNPLTLQILHYIQYNIEYPITLQQIADKTHFSAAHCSAVFKKDIGMSIIDFCIEKKIELAKKMILEGLELRQIAEELGFEDYNYFSRLFKKKTSLSPLQYKKQTKPLAVQSDIAFNPISQRKYLASLPPSHL